MSGRYSPDDRDRYERDHRRESRDDGWQKEPASTVLIKNVADEMTESDLYRWFSERDVDIRTIRLINKKPGGRGGAFAFVEFHTVRDSADWMNKQQGLMKLTRDHISGLVYSRTNKSSASHRDNISSSDWTCPNPRCAFVNFAKRNECFRCTTSREKPQKLSSVPDYEQADDDGSSQIGQNPCNTVILRGLDALTTEEALLQALAKITSLEPKNCYVMRNFTTGVSLGYAFMEFSSATDGRKIREHFNKKQSFEVDGKIILVEYAKNTYSTILASLQYQNMGNSKQTSASASYDYDAYRQPTEYELQAMAASSANQVTTAQQQQAEQVSESSDYQTEETASASTGGYTDLPQYPDPDTSQYVWDEQTGYYYDHSTGLYYDANTQYYYNMTTQEFMYWDHENKTYRPLPNQESQQSDQKSADQEDKKKKAKNIAKEMARWAKSQNKKSKSATVTAPLLAAAPAVSVPAASNAGPNQAAAADMAYDVLMGNKKFSNTSNPPNKRHDDLMPPPALLTAGMKRPAPVAAAAPGSGLVASYGDDSDGEDEPISEANHIDRQKLTCNLCERKFNSTAILEKHVAMSDLHKQNLAKFQQKSQGQLTKQYRDRAKERRLKEGGSGRAQGFLHPQRV